MRQNIQWFRILMTMSAWLWAWHALQAQTITWLGVLPTHSRLSEAFDVSCDGTVVVGYAFNFAATDREQAFRWTAQTGMMGLGTLGGASSAAHGVSADGSVVVGWAKIPTAYVHAFRWENGVMTDLGTFSDGVRSFANDVSADGSVVVGVGRRFGNVRERAFRWTAATGLVDLGNLVGTNTPAGANDVSADGNVVVGYAYAGSSNPRVAFRWTAETGMVSLGVLYEEGLSEAFGVSPNGAIVVGWAEDSDARTRAFRWTAEGGMVDLGAFESGHSEAYAVTDSGVVVGLSLNANSEPRAFRWTEAGGMQDLNEVYASLFTDGSILLSAEAITPDARYIVGAGYNGPTGRPEGYLLDTWRTGDTNGDGCINDSDLLAVLFAFGTPGTGLTRHEDINKDGIVDDADLLIVLFNFGQGC